MKKGSGFAAYSQKKSGSFVIFIFNLFMKLFFLLFMKSLLQFVHEYEIIDVMIHLS